MAKFTVYTDKHNEYRWKFVASNGIVVAKSGDSYLKEEECLASLNLLQQDIGGAPVGYQLRKGVHPATPAKAAAPAIPAPPAPPAN
jgi:uncharacterized protein YegP (UPF0339 family)